LRLTVVSVCRLEKENGSNQILFLFRGEHSKKVHRQAAGKPVKDEEKDG
jgi:hypothetical protein